MSINLLELMGKAVSNQVVGKVAGIIGVDEASANKAVGAVLPALLAGFIGKASTPAGAEQLGAVLDQADGTILDNIGDILGGAGGGSDQLLKMGNDLIGGLLGDKASAVVDLISKVSGLNKESAGSLIGMIAPLIFSLLGKQKKTLGLDAGGLAKLLLGQKEFLKGVLPAGMGAALGLPDFDHHDSVAEAAGNLKDAVVHAATDKVEEVKGAVSAAADKVEEVKSSAVHAATDKVEEVKSAASSAVSAAAHKAEDVKSTVSKSAASVADSAGKTTKAAAKSGGGFMKFLFTILILAVLGFLVWKFVLPKLSGGISSGASVPAEITPANAVATMGGVISDAKSTFKGIKDADSARAALPKIDSIGSRVSGIASIAASLPAPVREQLKKAVTDFAPQFISQIEKVYAIPGVREILEPKVDDLISKFELFG